ncbi:MAG: hypothetical protein VYC73_03935, partial [Candidatus Thermoplasmatota archaeon]|nr:hypothetical protein [Candidatus Thermoplasmatota archaeon]
SHDSLEEHESDSGFSDSNGNQTIQGQSFLNFTNSISHSSQVNATWFAQVSVLESYGTDLLENRSIGLLDQIDQDLGNSDGWIDESEANSFSELVVSSRNWTDSFSGGCCAFDYSSMSVVGSIDVSVNPPEIGPTNRTGGEWGWTESGNLIGTSDGRTLRLIDLPRVGALIEEVPLRVSLPEGWEFKFSPMSEIISGSPGAFVVDRSQAPVAYDIRITIDRNMPPVLSAISFPQISSTISLAKSSLFTATCSDNPLENPRIEWTISRSGTTISSFENDWISVKPSDLNFTHGDVMSVNATCIDFHGSVSHWNDNPTVDGIPPDWSGKFTINGIEGDVIQNGSQTPILAPAGSLVRFDVNASDDSSLPVLLELYTNVSEGWRQTGLNQQTFEFTANQGMGINGADMGIDERHLQRAPSEILMALVATDDAGNTVLSEWTLRVLDANPPTVIPRLFSDGIEIEYDDKIHENDELELNLSHSYDDLDPIGEVSWSILVDGEEIFQSNPDWSVFEPISLSFLTKGTHSITVKATDSKGNIREEPISITVEPRSGAHISVVEATLPDDARIVSSVMLTVLVQNDGSDPAFARVCLSDICGRWTEEPFAATLESGPGQATIEFQFEMQNDTVEDLYLSWDSASSGTYGDIPMEVSLKKQPGIATSLILAVIIGISALSLAWYRNSE